MTDKEKTMKQADAQAQAAAPWWKHGYVWMILAGPAVVVVAGFATFAIAVGTPDPVVATDYYRRGVELNKTLRAQDKATLPAVQGRNHAATPSRP
jgi:hypothetical protein